MSTPPIVQQLQHRLTVSYGVGWALSVAVLVGVALLISARSLDGELEDAVQLRGMAVYGLAWIDEDGFHQQLDLDDWLLDDGMDVRVLLADGTPLYSQPRLDLPPMPDLIAEVMVSERYRMINGTDARGVDYRMVVFPLYGADDSPVGASMVATDRSPFVARWRRLAGGLLAASGLIVGLGLWLGARLARRSLVPLLDAMRERELLLAAAAHELRTPLASLTAIIESARAGDEPAEQALPRLQRVLSVATERVGRLMTWARLGSTAALPHEPLRLDLLVEQVIDEQPVSLQASACVVHGDAASLSVAVRNLLENARRHGQPPFSVTVAEGCVAVSDHGTGFVSIERAGEPFSSRPDSPGSGLGLDIVRRVAEAHGGALILENRPEGGARVVLRLPAPG